MSTLRGLPSPSCIAAKGPETTRQRSRILTPASGVASDHNIREFLYRANDNVGLVRRLAERALTPVNERSGRLSPAGGKTFDYRVNGIFESTNGSTCWMT